MLRISRPSAPVSAAPYFVLLVAITASVSWRPRTYFEGSFDPVVVAKAVLSLTALCSAFWLARNRTRRPIGALIPVLVLLYLVGTVFGGWAGGGLIAAFVVASRVLILLVTVVLLAMTFDMRAMLTGLVGALATVGLVAAITGLPTLEDDRLRGGIPPLHSNEIAAIASICVLWTLHRFVSARSTLFDVLICAVAVSAVVGTGSRTALIVLIPAALLVLAFGYRFRITFLLPAIVMIPGALWLAINQDALRTILTRGGASGEDLASLNNRTVAWAAALAPKPTAWSTWLGEGLSQKQIQVDGQGWSHQILDSSWVSAFIQGGYIGLALVVLIALAVVLRSLLSDRDFRGFRFGLAVFLVARAALESGLFDASAAFVALAVLAVIPREPTMSDEQKPPLTSALFMQSLEMTGNGTQMQSTLRWRAAITCLAGGLVAAGLFNYFSPREYDASVSLYAHSATPQTRPSAVYQGTLTVAARMDTYVQLAHARVVTDEVKEELSLDESASSLRARVTVANPTDTTVIIFTIRDRDPANAQIVAAAVADHFIETVSAIETANEAPAQVQFQVVQPATAQLSAVSPSKLLNMAIGGLIGGLVGIIVGLWPFIRIVRSASDNLTIVLLGPLADRIRWPSPSPAVVPPATPRDPEQGPQHQPRDVVHHA